MWTLLIVAWVGTFDGSAAKSTVTPLTAHYNSPGRCEAEAKIINDLQLVKIIDNMEYVVAAVCQPSDHSAGARREYPS